MQALQVLIFSADGELTEDAIKASAMCGINPKDLKSAQYATDFV